MLPPRGIFCILAFVVLTRAQGFLGGRQYPPCNTTIQQGSQYIGCYDLNREVVQLKITGTDSTLYSYYPGWIGNSDPTTPALYDNSIDPANCTIACRGHGYKYAALYGSNSCRCMGNAPSTLAPLSSTNPLDPATLNSCHVPGQYLPGNCPGDSSQFCGTGTYADVYVDNSFPDSSTIDPVAEENRYGYIGCFHPGAGNNAFVALLSFRVPAANVSGATSLTPCFEYCASLGFPFVEFDGANLFTSCLCGTEISHGYQQLDSFCKGDCIGGSTCPGGNGCCGQRRSNTVYMNPNLVGCYEAPIPSASFAGAPVQTYSEPAGGPTMVGHTLTTASYAGPFVVATNPPSVPPFHINFYNLGCWQRTLGTAPIISSLANVDNIAMTVDSCLNICYLEGYSYASLTNETTNGFTCRCGNSFGANNGQQPAASCHQLCPGNSPPQTYEYCGGVAVNEQIFGPQPISSTSTATKTTTSTVASTATTSTVTSTVTTSTVTTSTYTTSTPTSSVYQSQTASTSSSPTSQPSTCSKYVALASTTPSLPSAGSISQTSPTSSSSTGLSTSASVLSLTSTIILSSSSTQSSSIEPSNSSTSSSAFTTVPSSSASSLTSSSQSQTSSSAPLATNTVVLDCQPDNCLRQFRQSTSVTDFCATYTTALQSMTTGLPNFVSQCSGSPSRISSACSCVVTSDVQTTTTATVTTTITTTSAINSLTQTSTTLTTSSTVTSSPTGSSSSPSSTSTTLSQTSTTASSTILTDSTVQPSTTSTTTPPVVNNCSPDNCLRQFQQSSAVTPFCQTYTTAVQTETVGLPPFVSQCKGSTSRVSSACSCVVTGSLPPPPSSTATESKLPTNTVTTSYTTSDTTTPSSTKSLAPTTSETSTSITNAPTLPPQNCSPDNCYRQFQQSSAITPFCETYTTALLTDTTGLPTYVSQCQSVPARISSACSCFVTGGSQPTTTTTTTTTSTTDTTSTTTTSTITVTSSTSGTMDPTETSNPTPTVTPPAQNCSPDNCYRQFQQSSAVTPFCETYTAALHTDTIGLPPYVSQCQSMPARISSACSCFVTGGSPPTTTSTTSVTLATSTTTGTSPVDTSVVTPTATPPTQNCSPDNCYRQFQQSSAVTPFCETYTTALHTDATGLPPYVSQCQSIPSRISSACSCLVTSSSPPNPTVTTSHTEINIATTNLKPSTSTAEGTTSISAPTPPIQNCSPDNCLRQFSQSTAEITPFCATYTTALQTETAGLPPFVSQCSGIASRISSACSCFVPSGSITFSESPPSPTSSITSAPTTSPASPAQNCSPDNCLRQFSQSLAEVSTFCATYTTALDTETTGLPTFVSQCSSSVSRVSSACSCIVTPPTTPPSNPATSTITTSTPATAALDCQADNCLRQFSQSLTEVSTFCATYTTALHTETTGLPTFVSQCSSSVSRVSSACSCIVPQPNYPPPSTEASQTSNSPSVLTTALCGPDYGVDCPNSTGTVTSSPAAETGQTSNSPSSPTTTALCGLDYGVDCPNSTDTNTSPSTTDTDQTSNPPSSPTTTALCGPDYGVDCPNSSNRAVSPSTTSEFSPTSVTTDIETNSYTLTTTSTVAGTEISSITSLTSAPTATLTDSETLSQTALTSSPSSGGTNTKTTTPTTALSPTSAPTNKASVPVIFAVQPGNSGYYKKRQMIQSYVSSGGNTASNCSTAAVYILLQNQLFTDGQPVSQSSTDAPYDLFAAPSGSVGTVTTTFAIDDNNLLTWHNATFVNGQAYFCQSNGQIFALFNGLYYQGYPPNCEIVSLFHIPVSTCQNGIITTLPTLPIQSTPATQASTSSGGTETATGDLTGTTSSEGSENNAPNLPPNIYRTKSGTPPGQTCSVTELKWSYFATAWEPLPTYVMRRNQLNEDGVN